MTGLTSASFGLAIGAGLLAALNPCGFALLPAYLSSFVIGDAPPDRRTALRRALKATVALTLGFGLVFVAVGFAITSFAAALQAYLPWFTAALGLVLALAGGWVALGRNLPQVRLRGRAARQARPVAASWPAMFGFGISYGIASVSCTLAPFLAVVTAGLRSTNPATGLVLFAVYTLGMGLTVGVAALSVALAHRGIVTSMRRVGAIVPRLAGVVLAIGGLYITWYAVWEIRVLHGDLAHDPVVSIALDAQTWLSTHAHQAGPIGLGAVLILLAGIALIPTTRLKTIRSSFKKHQPKGGTMTMQAVFEGTVIAESAETVIVEGNHYFPADSVNRKFITPSSTHTTCAWKGVASYYTVEVDGSLARDAAWYYPTPSPMAAQVKDRVAFWRGVEVRPSPGRSDEVSAPSFDAPEGATC